VFANNPGKTAEFINIKEHPMVKNIPEKVYDEFVIIAKDWMWNETARRDKMVDSRMKLKAWINSKTDDGKKDYIVKIKNELIDNLTISNTSIKAILSKWHDKPWARDKAAMQFKSAFKKATYVGWCDDQPLKGFKKHTEADYWLYYEVDIDGIKSYINVMKTVTGEYKPHAIEVESDFLKKEKFIKKGKPTR
jgi:hypothetical protein